MDYEIYCYVEQPTQETLGLLMGRAETEEEAVAFFRASEDCQEWGGCVIKWTAELVFTDTPSKNRQETVEGAIRNAITA